MKTPKVNFIILFSLLAGFSLVSTTTRAQQVDYNTIILPKSARDVEFVEKLVQLAWANNPKNQNLTNLTNISNYEIKQAKSNWLNQVVITGNINEFTINPPAEPTQGLFYPRYNVSAFVRVGNFFTDPLEVKIMKEQKIIAEQNINGQKLAVRAEVLRRYQTYLTNVELLKVQTEGLEDAFANFSLSEQNFKSGRSTVEAYNNALGTYNTQKSQKILAEGNVSLSKINVEELIGMRLEDVN